jgi:uncharacterized repeat protein (TIGR01451 family)/CSLREA domain-containing protein
MIRQHRAKQLHIIVMSVLIASLVSFVSLASSLSQKPNRIIKPVDTVKPITFEPAEQGFPYLPFSEPVELSHSTQLIEDSLMATVGPLAPLGLVQADVDDDGLPDLIQGTTSASGGVLRIYKAGYDDEKDLATFREAGTVLTAVVPDVMVAGDFNGDAHQDVIVGSRERNQLLVLDGDGQGRFRARAMVTPGPVRAMMVADLPRTDSHDDLIMGVGGKKLLIYQNWESEFRTLPRPHTILLPSEVVGVTLTDFNGDHVSDLEVTLTDRVVVMYGSNTRPYLFGGTPRGRRWTVLPLSGQVVTAIGDDFTGDRKKDLVLQTAGGKLLLYTNEGLDRAVPGEVDDPFPAKFAAKAAQVGAGPIQPLEVVAANLDGDRAHDLAVLDRAGHQVVMIRGDHGSGAFEPPVMFRLKSEPVAMLRARVNVDARDDLVVLDSEGRISMLLSLSAGSQLYGGPSVASRVVAVSATDAGAQGRTPVQGDESALVAAALSTVVTNTNDSGDGSLRQAILNANANDGPQTITFQIPANDPNFSSGVVTIPLSSQLPGLINPNGITVNGNSQRLFTGPTNGTSPVIVIDGNGADFGFILGTDSNTIHKVQLIDFTGGPTLSAAIVIFNGAANNQMTASYLGIMVSAAGTSTTDTRNTTGVLIEEAATSNILGSTTNAKRNVISKNSTGIEIRDAGTSDNMVLGNYIGTDVAGTAALGNIGEGVVISDAPNNTIGGTTAGARNVISGNYYEGVKIEGSGATLNQVLGNYIGTDVAGIADRGNSSHGVFINGAASNMIGGTASGARNLISGNDANGVLISGSGTTMNQVQGNYIGTDKNGTGDMGNTNDGVGITDAPGNIIGGATTGARNLISGNDATGVAISGGGSTMNQVLGNYIGTDVTGTADLGNSTQGVFIGGPSNTIGGTADGVRNLISGNNGNGVWINGSGSTLNQVQGNYIGTDVTGTADLGNSNHGVLIALATNNTIGGTTTSAGNIISGNGGSGVQISNFASGNRVQGNRIGTDVTGTQALGNAQKGVAIASAANNTIGGTNLGEGNVIAFNVGDGAFVDGFMNRISRNALFSNGGLGIDLFPAAVTANDADDGDAGANLRQNFPVLTSASSSGGNTTIIGSLNSTANTTFTLEFFVSAACDPSGYGEGQTFLGSTTVTTVGTDASFTATLAVAVSELQVMTATATDPGGNTSEFSKCTQVGVQPGPTYTVNTSDDIDDGLCTQAHCSLREAITVANAASGMNTIAFAIPGSGVRTISPTSALPTITDPVIIDGLTQSGASCTSWPPTLRIELHGSNTSFDVDGLRITAGSSTVRGLVINRFPQDGIELSGNGGNAITCNYIGTDATGTQSLGNNYDGVLMSAPNNTIGGTASGTRNLISGNTQHGVEIKGSGATGNKVQGNYIGTDVTGTIDLGNRVIGVSISNAPSNTIGGTATGARNLISGNNADGVLIEAEGATGNVVQGNYIGTDVTGTMGVGNTSEGVAIFGGSNNTIGGTAMGAGNTIAFNGSSGVRVHNLPASGIAIGSNSIHDNGGLGIDLGTNGVSTNDADDLDTGPNGLQNFPVLSSAVSSGGSTRITLTLNSTANTTLRLDFFATAACDPSGYGEGQTFLGSTPVTTVGNTASFTAMLTGMISAGQVVTATATDPNGNTSEFSQCVQVLVGQSGPAFTVNASDDVDDGLCTQAHCSLREAINVANSASGMNIIAFAIPGSGVRTISPTSALPTITGPVIIDGLTQPGASCTSWPPTLLIELNGSSAGSSVHGLHISGGGSTVRGLVINRFSGDGIKVSAGGGTTVACNFIGTDVTGTMDRGNNQDGINIDEAPNNTIGGIAANARNLISGNDSDGVEIVSGGATMNQVLGNYIGTDVTGTADLGNSGNGVFIFGAPNNTIGGTASGARNVISGNGASGVEIAFGGATGNKVQGNYIGTNVNGTAALGNTFEGVVTRDASNTIIGGSVAGAGNLISGNGEFGVAIVRFSGGSTGNQVQGNSIGTDVTGTAALGNSSSGVYIFDVPGNTIGGATMGTGNTIAFNGSVGVSVNVATGNRIQRNSIHDNLGLGIDLSPDGATANDANDSDVGANGLQNFPVLTSASSSDGSTTLGGTLNTTANKTFRLEFFANNACDPSGKGEGQTFIGSTSVMTDGSGDASFSLMLGTLGPFITATATDPDGNTSEFSDCIAVVAAPDFSLSCASSSLSTAPGGTATTTCSVSAMNGFDSSVNLSYSDEPSGISCSFNPTSITGSGSSTLTVNVSSSVSQGGSYPIEVVGTSGSLTRTFNLNLTVTPPPNFSVSCSASSLSAAPGGSATTPCSVSPTNGFNSTVNLSCSGQPSGVSCGFNPGSVTGSGSSTLTITVDSSVSAGGSYPIEIVGTSGSLTRTFNLNLNVTAPPDFSLSCNPSSVSAEQGGSATSTCTVTSLNGFNSTTNLSCANLPANVTCRFSSSSVRPPANGSANRTLTVNVGSGASAGASTFQVVGTSGSLSHTSNVQLNVTVPVPIADLSLTARSSPTRPRAGETLTYTLTVRNGGPASATGVTLTDTLPGGVTFVSAIASQGTCSLMTGKIICNLGGLSRSATAMVTIVIKPTAAGTITNTATVAGVESDPNPASNTRTTNTQVRN